MDVHRTPRCKIRREIDHLDQSRASFQCHVRIQRIVDGPCRICMMLSQPIQYLTNTIYNCLKWPTTWKKNIILVITVLLLWILYLLIWKNTFIWFQINNNSDHFVSAPTLKKDISFCFFLFLWSNTHPMLLFSTTCTVAHPSYFSTYMLDKYI